MLNRIKDWIKLLIITIAYALFCGLCAIIIVVVAEALALGVMVLFSYSMHAEKLEFGFNYSKKPAVISPVMYPGPDTKLGLLRGMVE